MGGLLFLSEWDMFGCDPADTFLSEIVIDFACQLFSPIVSYTVRFTENVPDVEKTC